MFDVFALRGNCYLCDLFLLHEKKTKPTTKEYNYEPKRRKKMGKWRKRVKKKEERERKQKQRGV